MSETGTSLAQEHETFEEPFLAFAALRSVLRYSMIPWIKEPSAGQSTRRALFRTAFHLWATSYKIPPHRVTQQ